MHELELRVGFNRIEPPSRRQRLERSTREISHEACTTICEDAHVRTRRSDEGRYRLRRWHLRARDDVARHQVGAATISNPNGGEIRFKYGDVPISKGGVSVRVEESGHVIERARPAGGGELIPRNFGNCEDRTNR